MSTNVITTNIYYQWVGNGFCEAYAIVNGKRVCGMGGGAAAKFEAIDKVRSVLPARYTCFVVHPPLFYDYNHTRPLTGKALDVLRSHAVDCPDNNRPLKLAELVAQVCYDYVALADHRAAKGRTPINVDSVINDMYQLDASIAEQLIAALHE